MTSSKIRKKWMKLPSTLLSFSNYSEGLVPVIYIWSTFPLNLMLCFSLYIYHMYTVGNRSFLTTFSAFAPRLPRPASRIWASSSSWRAYGSLTLPELRWVTPSSCAMHDLLKIHSFQWFFTKWCKLYDTISLLYLKLLSELWNLYWYMSSNTEKGF